MHKPEPPFDAFPDEHASAIAGPMDMEEFEPIAIEQPYPVVRENEPTGGGCLRMIAKWGGGAILAFGGGYVGSSIFFHVLAFFLGVEVPWGFFPPLP